MSLQLDESEKQKIKNQLASVEAIIFDMDGLMIDSEPFHAKAFDYVFQKFGKRLTEEENNQWYVGISDKDAAQDMVRRFNLPIDPEELIRQKQKAYLDFLVGVKPQPGLLEFLEFLQKNKYRKAIASSSMLTEIEAIMDALKIRKYFETFCSAQEVEHGKPAPDVFLLAAKRLGIDPEKCLVLEDATSGIVAAKVAGMKSVAIPSRETMKKDFSGATLKLNSLSEVILYLSK